MQSEINYNCNGELWLIANLPNNSLLFCSGRGCNSHEKSRENIECLMLEKD